MTVLGHTEDEYQAKNRGMVKVLEPGIVACCMLSKVAATLTPGGYNVTVSEHRLGLVMAGELCSNVCGYCGRCDAEPDTWFDCIYCGERVCVTYDDDAYPYCSAQCAVLADNETTNAD